MHNEFNSDPRFELQWRSASLFLGKLKTRNFCDAKTVFCAMAKRGKLGIRAVCSALKRCLHSQKDVDEKYPNAIQCNWLEGLLVVDQGVIKVNHKDQVCIFST